MWNLFVSYETGVNILRKFPRTKEARRIKIDARSISDHLREFRVHSRSKRYNSAWNIAAQVWREREGSPRRDHLWFRRWDSGNSTHSRTEKDRWNLAWLGRTNERTNERRGGRSSERKRQASVTEIWPRRRSGEAEKCEARERKLARRRRRNGLGKGDRVGAGGRSTAPCMG